MKPPPYGIRTRAATLKGWALCKRVKPENADQNLFVSTCVIEDSDLGILWALASSAPCRGSSEVRGVFPIRRFQAENASSILVTRSKKVDQAFRTVRPG